MRYDKGQKVKVVLSLFEKLYGKNEWIIDHIRVQGGNFPSVYICYNLNDERAMHYRFLENEVEAI